MIEARAGQLFEVTVVGYPTGRYGFIGVALEDGEGNVVTTRRVTGIVESPAGIYNATMLAPMTPGTYTVNWDNDGAAPTSEQVNVVSTSLETMLPTVEMVARFIRARTKDDGGNEVGTFNEDTRPTGEDVVKLMELAAMSMPMCIGPWLPESLFPLAQMVISLRTALFVEITYWPEQIEDEDSSYEQLKQLFDEQREILCGLAAEYRPDTTPGDGSGELPLFYFGDLPVGAEESWYNPVNQTAYVQLDGRIVGWRYI